MRRVLDLRTGVLYEHGRNRDRRTSRACVSLRLPGRRRPSCEPGFRTSLRAGPPLLPPADDDIHDDGPRRRGHVDPGRRLRRRDRGGGAPDPSAHAPRPMDDADTEDGRPRPSCRLPTPTPTPSPTRLPASTQLARPPPSASTGYWPSTARRGPVGGRTPTSSSRETTSCSWAIRFALFHLMASVADSGEAAVGARGLTGTGYRGHVFWDADTFVLPFLAATHPASARAMLEYRLRRLPAAIEAARAVGRAGARFPWESARTGRDVTPTSARDRSGRHRAHPHRPARGAHRRPGGVGGLLLRGLVRGP